MYVCVTVLDTKTDKSNYSYSKPMGKKFDRLERHIQREYEKKGYSTKEAKHIGFATAGKIAHLKHK